MPEKIAKKIFGGRAFQVAAPRLWNKLPATLRTLTAYKIFNVI